MAQTIKLRRSATPGNVPDPSALALGEVAINTYDGKMYIKKNVDGTETVIEVGSSGAQLPTEGIWKQYSYTASAGQAVFSGDDDNSQSLTYSAGYIEVYLNGILLDPAVDYTATTGNSITLSAATELDDLVQIDSFSALIGPGDIVVNTFTGDGTTTSFALGTSAGTEQNVSVFIDGVYQEKDTFSLSGDNLVFTEAPYTDASIEAVIGSRNITIDDINDLTITGDFSASGAISGNTFSGTSATLTGQMSSGSVSTGNITSTGTIDADGDITTDTDVNANNVVATNDITATGSITAPNLLVSNWNTAYGWGDHSTQSYATESSVNTAIDTRVDTAFIANLVDATNIDYDNTVSGISANTVQEAIDYLNTLSGGGNQGDVASYTREKFTATADQTTFTLADGYTLGYLEVFLNGVLLDTSDYTANDESTVVLGVGAKAGDELITIALDSFAIAELLRVTSISASAPDDAITVDASGNLLIGRTVAGSDGTGHTLRGGDSAIFARVGGSANSEVIQVCKNTYQGKAIQLRLDGTEVGNIGIRADNEVFIANSSNVGLATEQSGPDRLEPCTGSGTTRDDAIDLGGATSRFRNLYLGGGVVFDDAGSLGTAQSNTLDSYEEGTFTPTIGNGTYTFSNLEAKYFKIGNMVHFHIGFRVATVSGTSSSTASITGLPFTGSYYGSYQEPHITPAVIGKVVDAGLAHNISFYIGNSSNTLFARNGTVNSDSPVNTLSIWKAGTFIKIQGFYYV